MVSGGSSAQQEHLRDLGLPARNGTAGIANPRTRCRICRDVTLTGVPTPYSRMLPHLRDRARLRSLRFLRCGPAPITVCLNEEVETADGVPLVVSYGLSEATCTSTHVPRRQSASSRRCR